MSFADIHALSRLDFAGRRVFLSIDSAGPSAGLARLRPALEPLLKARCKVVLALHVAPAADFWPALAAAFPGSTLRFDYDFASQVAMLRAGTLGVCPPLSSYAEELECDPAWAQRIAESVDVYVCEAPLAARHATASNVLLPRLLPTRGVGPLLAADLSALTDLLDEPTPPVSALIGGAGVVAKRQLLRSLVERADHILLAGVIANTFLVALGWQPRDTLYEPDGLQAASEILALARERGVQLALPSDVMVAPTANAVLLVNQRLDELEPGAAALDIGTETLARYEQILRHSATVLCCGSLGQRHAATKQLWQAALAAAPYTFAVGDSTAQLVAKLGLSAQFRAVTSGGDATLDLLAGVSLPGVQSLRR